MYHYFISFSHMTDGNFGFGNIDLMVDSKITERNILNKITKDIERDCLVQNVVILNFQLLGIKIIKRKVKQNIKS